MEPQSTQSQNPSFFSKYKFTLISLCILIIAIVPLIILSQKSHKSTSTPPNQMTQTLTPTPTSSPVTSQNVEPTLSATDQEIQNSLNQVDTDLNSVNQINTSSDTTTGL